MWKRVAFAAFVLAGFASGAFAQTFSTNSQSSSDFGSRPSTAMGVYGNYTQMTLLRHEMNDEAKSDVTPEQRRRAYKAVALIKDNHCQDAYNLALAEQDNRLALNVAVACKAQLRQ